MRHRKFQFRKNIFLGTLLLILFFSFSRCTYHEAAVPQVPLPDTVSFSKNVQPIFTENCAISGCHDGSSSRSNLNLSSSVAYNNLFLKHEINTASPTMSNLYIYMTTTMPPSGRVSNYYIAMVLKWIEQGAKNN